MSNHKKTLVLDTSIFVNPASAQAFGRNATEAFRSFLEMAEKAVDLELLMPPSIYSELMHFAEESKIPAKLLLLVQKRPPKKYEIKIPGIFVYHLVDSMRDRVDRGLRLAERQVREALQAERKDVDGELGKLIRSDANQISALRESYRRIMREGMLDSRADVDLLLLAYEADAQLVSADIGVLEWAGKMGIRLLAYQHLSDFVGSLRRENAL